MEIVRGQHNLRAGHRGSVVTIGNFDGVHRGHRMLLEAVQTRAEQHGCPATLVTFEPLPREFFRGAAVPARLTRFREKMLLLRSTGLARVVLLPFNERTASMTAAAVVDELLVAGLGVRELIVGDDFRFGRGAEGDFALLETAGARHGFSVTRMDTLLTGDARISSTRIRGLLDVGSLEEAAALLARPYAMLGRVVYGRQLGRTIGVPTANLRLQRYRSPVNGVFAVTARDRSGVERQGIANVGVRPTVDGQEPLLEVHLFDFEGDLYGERLCVTFRRKLRDEQAFDGIDALKAQITRDIDAARETFSRTEYPTGPDVNFVHLAADS
ncbi:MAG: bifunctional riboflavin kinase/FAD synthetase [Pseudomonadota bacterium]